MHFSFYKYSVEKKGPHVKPDKLRGSLHGSVAALQTQRPKVTTEGGLKLKLSK